MPRASVTRRQGTEDASQERRGSSRRSPMRSAAGLLVPIAVLIALLTVVAGCGTEDASSGAGTPVDASPPTVASPETGASPSTAAPPSAAPTASASAEEPDGTCEDRARYWVEQEEKWRRRAVEAVAAGEHPGGDVWKAMQEPMSIPETEMPDDPDAEAWCDLADLARDYAEWWQRVVDDPSLPFSQ